MQKQILISKFKAKVNFFTMYLHRIEVVEFINDSHGQTFPPTLYTQNT